MSADPTRDRLPRMYDTTRANCSRRAWPVPSRLPLHLRRRRPQAHSAARRTLASSSGLEAARQIDTFDPKRRGDGKKKPGSYYDAIPTAFPALGLRASAAACARLDRCVLIRSLNHKIIDEHAAATNLLHTGRRQRHGHLSLARFDRCPLRGPGGEGVPGLRCHRLSQREPRPRVPRSKHGYIYLTDTEAGPTGLTAPSRDPTGARRARRATGRASCRLSGEPRRRPGHRRLRRRQP